ncbi:hypothetical protein ACWGB8_17460 [Kitasatospora sp. NPDC054939]
MRLWPAVYPATGREGLPPVALVLEAGLKRTRRPGSKPLTPEQKAEQAKRDHQRLLNRMAEVEAATEAIWHAPVYPTSYDTATVRDHHRALPVVATTLPLLRRLGADAPVWHRFGGDGWHTLTDALDNPDGDELLVFEQAAADRARRAWEAAERERRRPACRRCSAKFSDERWEEKERGWNDDGLCAGCRHDVAEQQAREEAEWERAAAEAAAAEAKRSRSWWRRS